MLFRSGHATAAAHLLWQVFPRYPCLEYKDNSGQSCPVRYTRTASFGPGLMFWQKWLYLTPQFVAYQFPGHLLHPHWYFTAYSFICQVLLGALRPWRDSCCKFSLLSIVLGNESTQLHVTESKLLSNIPQKHFPDCEVLVFPSRVPGCGCIFSA